MKQFRVQIVPCNSTAIRSTICYLLFTLGLGFYFQDSLQILDFRRIRIRNSCALPTNAIGRHTADLKTACAYWILDTHEIFICCYCMFKSTITASCFNTTKSDMVSRQLKKMLNVKVALSWCSLITSDTVSVKIISDLKILNRNEQTAIHVSKYLMPNFCCNHIHDLNRRCSTVELYFLI